MKTCLTSSNDENGNGKHKANTDQSDVYNPKVVQRLTYMNFPTFAKDTKNEKKIKTKKKQNQKKMSAMKNKRE